MAAKPLIVNFFAGPGAAKSTMAAHLFAELKWLGIETELVREYAKDLVWLEDFLTLANQSYVTAKQLHRQYAVEGKVDIIVTDSPVLLGLVYEPPSEAYINWIVDEFGRRNNLNLFVNRMKPYRQAGRMQTEAGARDKDTEVRQMLQTYNIPFEDIPGVREYMPTLVERVLTQFGIAKEQTT
jgi:hypothetical protein